MFVIIIASNPKIISVYKDKYGSELDRHDILRSVFYMKFKFSSGKGRITSRFVEELTVEGSLKCKKT